MLYGQSNYLLTLSLLKGLIKLSVLLSTTHKHLIEKKSSCELTVQSEWLREKERYNSGNKQKDSQGEREGGRLT